MAVFAGVYPAMITPMKEGKLNEKALRQVLEFDIQAGVHGFWVAGGSGESVRLTDEENMRIAEIAVDQNRGRTKLIMHVGTATTGSTVKLAKHAAKAGVDAICCVPPFFYVPGHDGIVEHFRAVGDAAGLPLFVYNLPDSTGVEITPQLAEKIQKGVPQFAGLKHSSSIFYNLPMLVKMGLQVFIGNGYIMLSGLVAGAVGIIDGPVTVAPEIFIEIWNAYKAGDLRKAEAAQKKTEDLYSILFTMEFPASLRAMVDERLGIDTGVPRLPAPPLSAAERERVRKIMAGIKLPKVTAPRV